MQKRRFLTLLVVGSDDTLKSDQIHANAAG